MTYDILDATWYTPMTTMAVIGVVAIASGPNKENWKAYIGYGNGADERQDEQQIAAQGAKLSKEAACGHFPNLPPEEFIY